MAIDENIANAIMAVNKGDIYWSPGHDGVFGEFSFEEIKKTKIKSLTDF